MVRTGVTERNARGVAAGDQRGFTLIEVLIVVALLLVVIALGATSLAANTGRERAATLAFEAELDEARSVGAISGNGATVFVAPMGSGSLVAVYSGRPNVVGPGVVADRANPALLIAPAIALSIDGSAFFGTFALFVSSSGSVSALENYTVRQAMTHPLAGEPPCDASIAAYLTIAIAYATPRQVSIALSCAFARPNFGQP
ncbi:MAG: prepilin-type N-terminal cleavage/methylation domain-containing protein [Candidatus Baltobacteraceae bacterium]